MVIPKGCGTPVESTLLSPVCTLTAIIWWRFVAAKNRVVSSLLIANVLDDPSPSVVGIAVTVCVATSIFLTRAAVSVV